MRIAELAEVYLQQLGRQSTVSWLAVCTAMHSGDSRKVPALEEDGGRKISMAAQHLSPVRVQLHGVPALEEDGGRVVANFV